jgi:hypothetical protein
MGEETAAILSVPVVNSVEARHITEHHDHVNCEAHTPIGHVWLLNEWRQKQCRHFTMEFIALHGVKDDRHPDLWKIKMLMLLQRMEKYGHFWARERFQVMDCDIEQQHWLKIRAEAFNFKLV